MAEIDLIFQLQIISLVLSIGTFVYGLHWVVNHPKGWYLFTPVLALLIHYIIYYGVVIGFKIHNIPLDTFTGIEHFSGSWSAILRLHGIITLLCSMLIVDCTLRGIYGKSNYKFDNSSN